MTDFFECHIADLLRNTPIGHDPEIEAMAYAVLLEKQRILFAEIATRTMSMIDELPEYVLDFLAIELRTPAYSQDYSISVKRELVKGTLKFYSHLGTPWAVNWVIETVFGNGHIDEWFNYGGTPHHFRIEVNNDGTFRSLEGFDRFMYLVFSVKRLSSWLDEIIILTDMGETLLRFGGLMAPVPYMPVPEIPWDETIEGILKIGHAAAMTPRVAVPEIMGEQFGKTMRCGSRWSVMPVLPVPEIH